MLEEELQERIARLEELKNLAVAKRDDLMTMTKAKEGYIDGLATRLNDLYWVEEALKNEKR